MPQAATNRNECFLHRFLFVAACNILITLAIFVQSSFVAYLPAFLLIFFQMGINHVVYFLETS